MAKNASFSKVFNVKKETYQGKHSKKAVASFEDTDTGYVYIVSIDTKELDSTKKAGQKIMFGRITRMSAEDMQQTNNTRQGKF